MKVRHAPKPASPRRVERLGSASVDPMFFQHRWNPTTEGGRHPSREAGPQGAHKVRRTRRGKAIHAPKLANPCRGERQRSFSVTPTFVQFAGSLRAAGPWGPSLAVREGLGGLRINYECMFEKMLGKHTKTRYNDIREKLQMAMNDHEFM